MLAAEHANICGLRGPQTRQEGVRTICRLPCMSVSPMWSRSGRVVEPAHPINLAVAHATKRRCVWRPPLVLQQRSVACATPWPSSFASKYRSALACVDSTGTLLLQSAEFGVFSGRICHRISPKVSERCSYFVLPDLKTTWLGQSIPRVARTTAVRR